MKDFILPILENIPNVTPVYFDASFSQAFNKSFARRVVTADYRFVPRILLAWDPPLQPEASQERCLELQGMDDPPFLRCFEISRWSIQWATPVLFNKIFWWMVIFIWSELVSHQIKITLYHHNHHCHHQHHHLRHCHLMFQTSWWNTETRSIKIASSILIQQVPHCLYQFGYFFSYRWVQGEKMMLFLCLSFFGEYLGISRSERKDKKTNSEEQFSAAVLPGYCFFSPLSKFLPFPRKSLIQASIQLPCSTHTVFINIKHISREKRR